MAPPIRNAVAIDILPIAINIRFLLVKFSMDIISFAQRIIPQMPASTGGSLQSSTKSSVSGVPNGLKKMYINIIAAIKGMVRIHALIILCLPAGIESPNGVNMRIVTVSKIITPKFDSVTRNTATLNFGKIAIFILL